MNATATDTINEVATFQVGETYGTRTYHDGDAFDLWYTITKRTACFVTFTDRFGDVKRTKVHEGWRGDEEIIFPDGQHSMCTVIGAKQRVGA